MWYMDFQATFLSLPLFYDGYDISLSLNPVIYMWEMRLDTTRPNKCLTTSRENVIYIEILGGRLLKVWRLNINNKSESRELWQLLREETNMRYVRIDDYYCIPMAMAMHGHSLRFWIGTDRFRVFGVYKLCIIGYFVFSGWFLI